MGLLTIGITTAIGAASLPVAGLVLGVTAVGPVAGGIYATLQSAGYIFPVVQSTLMTVGIASIVKTAVLGAAAGFFI